MKHTITGIAVLALAGLMPVAALAEPNDRPPPRAPILHIVTYDTGFGTHSESYIFGHRVTGDIGFRTIGDRNTRKDGWATGPRTDRRHALGDG